MLWDSEILWLLCFFFCWAGGGSWKSRLPHINWGVGQNLPKQTQTYIFLHLHNAKSCVLEKLQWLKCNFHNFHVRTNFSCPQHSWPIVFVHLFARQFGLFGIWRRYGGPKPPDWETIIWCKYLSKIITTFDLRVCCYLICDTGVICSSFPHAMWNNVKKLYFVYFIPFGCVSMLHHSQ